MVPSSNQVISKASSSETPLRTTFKIRLNGETLSIASVGQAYRFLTEYSSVAWMEYRALHEDAVELLERAADDAMLAVPATNAVRVLLVSTKLL